MSFAELIAMEITRDDAPPRAVTLECGYAILHNGDRRTFQPARILQQSRNKDGRCTFLLAQYPDGSQLRFDWSEQRGPQYTVVEHHHGHRR